MHDIVNSMHVQVRQEPQTLSQNVRGEGAYASRLTLVRSRMYVKKISTQ